MAAKRKFHPSMNWKTFEPRELSKDEYIDLAARCAEVGVKSYMILIEMGVYSLPKCYQTEGDQNAS